MYSISSWKLNHASVRYDEFIFNMTFIQLKWTQQQQPQIFIIITRKCIPYFVLFINSNIDLSRFICYCCCCCCSRCIILIFGMAGMGNRFAVYSPHWPMELIHCWNSVRQPDRAAHQTFKMQQTIGRERECAHARKIWEEWRKPQQIPTRKRTHIGKTTAAKSNHTNSHRSKCTQATIMRVLIIFPVARASFFPFFHS